MAVESGQSTPDQHQAAFARGRALQAALQALGHPVHLQHAGDFLVAFFSTPAEGRYGCDDGVRWREAAPDATTHLAVVVLDAGDNRFVPELDVELEVWRGERLLHVHLPFEWHPALHHYGADADLPEGSDVVVVVRIAAPRYLRHDKVNGRRYAQPGVATFTAIELARGRNPHPHATPQGTEADVARASHDEV